MVEDCFSETLPTKIRPSKPPLESSTIRQARAQGHLLCLGDIDNDNAKHVVMGVGGKLQARAVMGLGGYRKLQARAAMQGRAVTNAGADAKVGGAGGNNAADAQRQRIPCARKAQTTVTCYR